MPSPEAVLYNADQPAMSNVIAQFVSLPLAGAAAAARKAANAAAGTLGGIGLVTSSRVAPLLRRPPLFIEPAGRPPEKGCGVNCPRPALEVCGAPQRGAHCGNGISSF